MVLLRQLLGDVLRRLRIRQGRTLREVSASARVSLGYLSEVERGQKEASSELLQAICTALGTPLSQVFREVSDNFALAELQSESMLELSREPVLRELSQRTLAGGSLAAGGLAQRELSSRELTAPELVEQPLAETAPHTPELTDMVPV
jgi:transcriptional regulator with XRE-family HTH domain